MIFNYLDATEVESLAPLIPEDVMEGTLKVVSVSEEEGLRGFAVIECEADDFARLKWLYIFEKYRGQGYGSALVAYIADTVNESKDCILSSLYEANTKETGILNRIFVKKGFEVESAELVTCQADRDQIMNSPIMKNELKVDGKVIDRGDIYPLEEVSIDVLEDFMERTPDFSASVSEILGSNGILSLAFGVNGTMTGLMLVQDTEDDAEYLVTNIIFNDKDQDSTLFAEFFKKAMIYIVAADELVQNLHFVANSNQQMETLSALLGENIMWESTLFNTAVLAS